LTGGVYYEVLARKYRPQTFSELTGQEHVSRILQNAIDSGRIAHAFLFTGARGVGKTSMARILAKTLNCERSLSLEPCNACKTCSEITKGVSTDVFEIDGASNTGVDDIRELRDNVKYLPSHSRFKIFIIDEVHMLSTNAFNALLKTLEEPPEHVKFIFATTEPHKLPVTILSRCQRFDFKRVTLAKIIAHLRMIAEKENITISDSALALVARKGDGSMRDSLTAFDQLLACCGNAVTDEDAVMLIGSVDRKLLTDLLIALLTNDAQKALACAKQADDTGYNLRQFCQELIELFRHLMIIRSVQKPEEILDISQTELEELRSQANAHSILDIQRRLTLLLKAESDMALSGFSRLTLELALLKSATLEPVIPITELLEKLKNMEAGGAPYPQAVDRSPRVIQRAASQNNIQPNHPPTPSSPDSSPPKNTATASESSWERFVSFVYEKNPVIGSALEYGSPLKQEKGLMEIGFSKGCYYLSSLQDAESITELTAMASEFTEESTIVRITAIDNDKNDLIPSLAAKKERDREQHREELRREVSEHPVIKEALQVFGGSVTDIRETGKEAVSQTEKLN